MKPKAPNPQAVHASAIVIDTHADTPQRFLDEHFDLGDPLNGGDFNLEPHAREIWARSSSPFGSIRPVSRANTRTARWS